MTLCIGAICDHDGSPSIVLAADWRAQHGEWSGAEILDKLGWLKPYRWAVMHAGNNGDSGRMSHSFRLHFAERKEFPSSGVRALLDQGFASYRWSLMDLYAREHFGISYEEVIGAVRLPSGSTKAMPQSFIDRALESLEAITFPSASIMIAGFTDDGMPILCAVNESYDSIPPRIEMNFTAIGSGSAAAIMSLYRRRHAAVETDLIRAVYNVFEASQLAADAMEHVGRDIQINVLRPNNECWTLTEEGFEVVEDLYAYYGPMDFDLKRSKLKHSFQYEARYFEPYKAHWYPNLGK